MRDKWEKSLDRIKNSTPKNSEANRLKEKAIKEFANRKEKSMRTLTARRVQKINMKQGQVEQQEFYNDKDEKIGWFKTKNKRKMRIKDRSGKDKDVDVMEEWEGEMYNGLVF